MDWGQGLAGGLCPKHFILATLAADLEDIAANGSIKRGAAGIFHGHIIKMDSTSAKIYFIARPKAEAMNNPG